MKLGQRRAMDVESVSTGSLSLDIALGIGGLPKGRVVEVYGPESSGKTTLALQVVAEAQKAGGICAFVDAEHALDPVIPTVPLPLLRVKAQSRCVSRNCRPARNTTCL